MKASLKNFLLVLLTLVLFTGCKNDLKNIEVKEYEGWEIPLKQLDSIYYQDALELVKTVETSYPAFALGDIGEEYEIAKSEFLNSIDEATKLDDFKFLLRTYLGVLGDGHIRLGLLTSQEFLDLDYYLDGDGIFLLDENGNKTHKKLIKVGSIEVNNILDLVDHYFVAENETARIYNRSLFAFNYDIIERDNCKIDDNKVGVLIDDRGIISESYVGFVSKDPYDIYDYSKEIEWTMIDDIFYIDMNVCIDNSNLNKVADDLSKAVKGGIDKVIIDIRNNPGGNSLACEALLNAMGMEVPNYGVYVRNSDLVKANYGGDNEGVLYEKPNKARAHKNKKVNLIALINEGTFSSATMMGVFIQDGDLGTLIGRPSINSPSSYGDILSYRMARSGLDVSISYKKFLRPDTRADQKTLIPDILVDYDQDSMEIAIDYLKNK